MSFPRYPAYKDSGVEWLGEVPAHWLVITLGRVSLDRCDGPFGSGLKSTHYVDAGVRVVRLQNIRQDGFNDGDAAFIDERYYREELAGHDVQSGDVLIAGLGDDNNTVGRACVAPLEIEPAMVKADCFRFRLEVRVALPSFVALQLSASAARDAGVLSTGSTRSRIPLSVMASRKLGVPPLDEQRAIAAFLDRETTKIDALVAEQRRLMQLLKEKRQAVISHAVTKGLNPDAPMKDSGVEWLGDVPTAWTLNRLQAVCSFQSGKAHEPFFDDEGAFMCVTSRFVSTGGDKCKMCSENLSPAARNDTLMVMSDLPNGRALARGFYVADDRAYAVNQRVCILRPNAVVPKFLYYLLDRSPEFLQHDDGFNQTHLSNADFLKPLFPFPPLEEQEQIVSYLDVTLDRFDRLLDGTERAIAVISERRTALISAAVTGQIDVRSIATADAA